MKEQNEPATNCIVIRPVSDTDDAEWLRLRHALWPHHPVAELSMEMATMRANTSGDAIFVADCGSGILCGMVEVSIHASAKGCRTDRIGYLEGWYVDPPFRGLGIGRKLVEAAEDWSRSQGCIEMASDTTSEYPLSPAAHQKLGYEEVERCFYYRKELT